MIHSIADAVFSPLCHQEAVRCWAPQGNVLAFCQRCTGVYAGAALMLVLIPLMRFKATKLVVSIHGLFMAQMAVLGTRLIPDPATVRMLSGQLLIIGAFYFAWVNLQTRWRLVQADRSPRPYFCGVIIMVLVLQLLVRAPFSLAAAVVEGLGLLGLTTIAVLAILTVVDRRLLSVVKRSERRTQ